MSLNIDTSNTISGSKEQPQLERIADFYAGTSVFVTGGTGYLGKVIVEKLLRTCTGVRSVYVLLRPKRGKAPEQRLQDMIQTELFRVLRDKYADRLQKLKYIEGDMLADGLGMSVEATQLFRTEISVVVHSAATIRFDEPMRTAIDMNVLSLRRLMDLCGECHALKSIVVLSTSYVNGARKEVDEKIYAPKVSVDLDWFIETLRTVPHPVAWQLATHVEGPFANTYTVTKLLAEQIIDAKYQHLPICIVRPSIIMPTYTEPFPGWLDQIVGPVYFMSQAMLGTTTYFLLKAENNLDVVPLDFVSNMVLSAAWYNVTEERSERVRVFNCTNGALHPISILQGLKAMARLALKYASLYTVLYPRLVNTSGHFYTTLMGLLYHTLPAVVLDLFGIGGGRMLQLCRKGAHMTQQNYFFAVNAFTFRVDNVLRLIDRCALTADGTSDFNCDVRVIEYEQVGINMALGFRRHILRDPDSTLPRARARLRWIIALKYAHDAVHLAILLYIGLRMLSATYDYVK